MPETVVGRSWMVAAAALALYLFAAWPLAGVSGLVRMVVTNATERHELETRRVRTIDVDGVDPAAGGQDGVVAIWRGAWEVPSSGLYDLSLASEGPSSWRIDGVLANETATWNGGAVRRVVWLVAGFHAIDISYRLDAKLPRIQVLAAPAGEQPRPLAMAALKPRPPRNPRVRAVAVSLHRGLGCIALLTVVFAIRTFLLTSAGGWRWPEMFNGFRRAWLRTALAWTALAVVIVHGALLRIDAITARYGPVDGVSLVSAVQTRSILRPEAIRPASMAWLPEPLFAHKDGTATHYRSDPYTYLDAARNMSSFYGAHFREPVFPFATKIFLALLGGRDVAVSFASTFFSVLAIWLTYVLGAAIWSRPVGVAAALGFSLDADVIMLASAGWRDDAYVAVVALATYLMLRWWRAEHGNPQTYRAGPLAMNEASLMAIVAGVAGGVAILTRVMAVSFLIAGAAYIALARRAPWRRRLASVSLFAVSATLVAAPYFVNCWRVYGDPFYTFNVHGEIYSGAEGQAGWTGSTSAYVRQKIAQRPFEMLDTVAQGLTTYPFENKWDGLEPWVPGLRQRASLAAIAGLMVLAAVARGRLLLVLAIASVVPFSLTWTVDPDFRFTEHVYPPLLIAAALAVSALLRGVRALLSGVSRSVDPSAARVSWPAWAGVVGGALAVLWLVYRVGPPAAFAESLRAGEEATVTAGVRDGWSFLSGWSNPMRGGNVTMRVTTDEATVTIPLPEPGDYPVTIRMDPFPRPLDDTPQRPTEVEIILNGVSVTTIPLRWTAGRVGAYDVVLPAAAVRRGENRLVLRVNGAQDSEAGAVRPGLTSGDALALWYVRVRPSVDRMRR